MKDRLEDRCGSGRDNIEYGGVGAVPDSSVLSVIWTDSGKMNRCVKDALEWYDCVHHTNVAEVGA